jgi:outer membrane protein TolC
MKKWNQRSKPYIVFLLCSCLLGIGAESMAQAPVLSLENAVKTGLEKNYQIKILRNQELIATNNNTPGRAGMTPTLNAAGNISYAINNTQQQFFNGDTRGAPSAGTFNTRVGLEFDWVLFDGWSMYAVRDRFDAFERQSRAQTSAQIQNLAADIALAYYNIVQVERTANNLRYSLRLDRDLLDLVQRKKTIGSATGLEVLQSRSRLTADSTRLTQLEVEAARLHMAFNQLLNEPVDQAFSVDTTLNISTLLPLEELITKAKQANPMVIMTRIDRQISMLNTKEIKGNFMPQVDLVGQFNYSYLRNQVGFLLSNRNLGPTAGLSIRYPILDGGIRKQNLANAKIAEENARLREEDLLDDLEVQIRTRYADYQAQLRLRNLENTNLQVALDQATLARELYRLGRITNFEVREATLQEVQAQDRLIQSWFRLKQAEVDLLNLAGMLGF